MKPLLCCSLLLHLYVCEVQVWLVSRSTDWQRCLFVAWRPEKGAISLVIWNKEKLMHEDDISAVMGRMPEVLSVSLRWHSGRLQQPGLFSCSRKDSQMLQTHCWYGVHSSMHPSVTISPACENNLRNYYQNIPKLLKEWHLVSTRM